LAASNSREGAPAEAGVLPPRSAREALDRGRIFLESKGVEEFRLDAELLVAHALRLDRLGLFLQLERPIAEAEITEARELLVRRGKGEPVAYLTGEREFFGRPFKVGAGCLIPRPESEHLIDEARRWWLERTGRSAAQRDELLEANRLRAMQGDESAHEAAPEEEQPTRAAGPTVLDIGTGSGCLAVTLALELEGASVRAVDRSNAALKWARINAEELGAGVELHELDALEYLSKQPPSSLDLVVSNPPYVDTADSASLAREVRDFEPAEALFAPAGDVDFWIRELLQRVPALLRPGGLLLIELGADQGERALELGRASAPPNATVRLIDDLAGIPRVLALTC